LKNIKNELIGSVDAILLKPNCTFRAQSRDFISDHRELSITLNVGECSGLGEMPKKESKYFVDYDKMDSREIKVWWEKRILELNKPRDKVNCSDFIKLFGELTNELWTPKFNKKVHVDPEIEILERTESQNEFFEELCKNAPPEQIWSILNRVKNSKNKEMNRDVAAGAKTKFVKNRKGNAVPFVKIKKEIVEYFKKDIRQKRGSMLNKNDTLWLQNKLKNVIPDLNFIKKIDVIRALKTIKQNVSVGLDYISPKLIPTNSAIFIDALFHALRNAFTISHFPQTLKKS